MNKIILTGANRGLGKQIHDLLVEEKMPDVSCYFISRDSNAVSNKAFRYLNLDLGSKNIEKLNFGNFSKSDIVIFVNNAGVIDPIANAENVSVKELEYSLRVNCVGPFAIAQQLTKETKQIKDARLVVINVSSGAASYPVCGWASYCTSKAAAVMAFDVLAAEHKHVTVRHFDPGVMDTEMQNYIRKQSPKIMSGVDKFIKLKQKGSLKNPRDVAKEVFFMIQEEFK